MEQEARSQVKEVTLELTVIRADGTVDELGVVSHSNWFWNHGPGQWLARRRIEKANRRLRDAQNQDGKDPGQARTDP